MLALMLWLYRRQRSKGKASLTDRNTPAALRNSRCLSNAFDTGQQHQNHVRLVDATERTSGPVDRNR